MSDLSEVTTRKSRYNASLEALRNDSKQKITDSRWTFKSSIHAQIEAGSISYAEAAEAEEALKVSENAAEKQRVQSEFDSFQDVVLNPLHDMLNDRLTRLSGHINDLQHMLFSDAQALNPDHTQEAGDEEPELLEKLTQLKWLFEIREQIHRAIFDLLTQRNDTYREIVLLPYRQANNTEKVYGTESFFVQDGKDRQASFETESLDRYRTFLQIVAENVSRGVEMQSSAFWDIAPGLLDLLQKIPEDLRDFEGIRIPEQELEENEAYYRFPFQYLYSLLTHAERSAYQFIESQTNLQCLLHEVKTGVLTSRYRAIEAQKAKDGQDNAHLAQEVDELRSQEEAKLDSDLQQTVSMIEGQWLEALGSQLQGTKERTKNYLVAEGGWDDMDQDE